jgi:hypothetical protein
MAISTPPFVDDRSLYSPLCKINEIYAKSILLFKTAIYNHSLRSPIGDFCPSSWSELSRHAGQERRLLGPWIRLRAPNLFQFFSRGDRRDNGGGADHVG